VKNLLVRTTAAIALLLFFAASSLMANGTLKGKVFDKDSKEGLPGANVTIKGTSTGTASDLNGAFTITNVPPGTYTLQVSYVGYQTKTATVTVSNDATTVQDFALTSVTIQGQEFVVTAQAVGQMQAINQQLASNKIANMVSEERIQELPDFNAAAAISRLPGVSTLESSGEANKVVIRGLAPQFNQVAVSGIQMASTGSTQIGTASQGGTAGSINNDRSVDLTMVTPYMIKSIEVFKSLTPDMNANAIGGVVNMQLREAPSGLQTDFLWQSGYTAKTSNYGNYRGIASVSERFFDDALGIYFLGSAEQYDRDADNMDATYSTSQIVLNPLTGYNDVQVNSVQLNRHKETRKRFGGNLIMDLRLPFGILRSVNMFSRLNSDYRDYNSLIDYQNNNLLFRYRSGKGTMDVGVNSLQFESDFGFVAVDLQGAYTYSKNYLPDSPYYQFQQTGGARSSSMQTNVVPENLVSDVRYVSDTTAYLMSVSLFSSEYRERDAVFKGNFKVPFNLGTVVSGHIKFGGEFNRNVHTNDQNTPYWGASGGNNATTTIDRLIMDGVKSQFPFLTTDATGRFRTSNFTSRDSKLYDPFLDNRFGNMYWIAEPGVLDKVVDYIGHVPAFDAINSTSVNPGGWFQGAYQLLTNDYQYVEKYYAGYLMSQINIGPSAMVVGGVRYEEIKGIYQAYNLADGRNPATQRVFDAAIYPENHFILPQVQTKIDFADWGDVRYSYSQTLARPDYHQLSPHYTMDYSQNNVWAGNPNLRTAQAYNHDLIFTFHSNTLGLLSIGGFYKEVKNFTFYTQYKLHQFYDPITRVTTNIPPGYDSIGTYSTLGVPPKSGAWLYTYMNNPNLAFVRGVEIDLQTRFWYLPFPFDGMLLGINYTHMSSSAQYPLRDEKTVGRPGSQVITQIDSSRAGRLINQPNDIANAFLGYDYKGFSGKVSFVFQGNSVSRIGAFPEADGFTDDYLRIDASFRQILPWPGLQVFLDINNINNRMNVSRQISINGFTNEKHYGLVANLGVRYQIGH
jgi:TonB-dependent receptor